MGDNMIIIHNELVSIDDNDIVNDTVVIPDSVKSISPFAFTQLKIKYLIIPDSVTEIYESAFSSCEYLEMVALPKYLKKIRNAVFQNCINLKKVVMDNNVDEIMELSFCNCESLREINFSDKIKTIGFSAFYRCSSLERIKLPLSLEKIGQMAFQECTNLKEVIIPESLREIEKFSFLFCKNLESININKECRMIKDGSFDLCEKLNISFETSLFNYFKADSVNTITIGDKKINNYDYQTLNELQKNELIDIIYNKLLSDGCTYNLDKECFKNNAYSYNNFSNILDDIVKRINSINSINIEIEINKICALFPNTRFINFPSLDIFSVLDLNLCSKYNYRIFKRLQENIIFKYINNEIIVDLIGIFGLFENDKFVYKRLEELEKVLNHPIILDEKNYKNIDNNFKIYFKKINVLEYYIKSNNIPIEYSLYLKEKMNKNDCKLISKLNKRLGKQIQKFFYENYDYVAVNNYELITNDDEILEFIYNSNFDCVLNCNNLYKMFFGSSKKYNSKAVTFLINNIDYIINNSHFQNYIKNIIDRYDEIRDYYNKMGNSDINIIDTINYLSSNSFSNVKEENKEFSVLAKNAGIGNQKIFEDYQRLYEKMKIKRKSSIPRIVNFVNIDSDKLQIEILRMDDPLGLFVGEKRYTNSCLKLGDIGEDCLRHSISNGRTVCIYLCNNDEKIMLAESWIWRNGNLICFDNIEGTNYLKKHEEYKDLVFLCYQKLTKLLVKHMNDNYDYIGAVTVGKGQSDIDLSKYNLNGLQDLYFYPKNYNGYIDSKVGYFLYGNIKEVDTVITEPCIYMDERLIIYDDNAKKSINIINNIKRIRKESGCNQKYIEDLNNIKIILGEDWYLLHDDKHIIEFNMGIPLFDEYLLRDNEIEDIILKLKSEGIKLSINDSYLENIYNHKKKIK